MRSFATSHLPSKGRAALILLVGVVVAAFLAMGMSSAAFASKATSTPFALTVLTSSTEAQAGDRGLPVVGASVDLYIEDGADDEDDNGPQWDKVATYTTDATGTARIVGLDRKDHDDEFALFVDPTGATPDLDSAGWYIPSSTGSPACAASTSADFDEDDAPCASTSFFSQDVPAKDTVHLTAGATLSGTINDPEGNATTAAHKVVLLRKTTSIDGTYGWTPAGEKSAIGASTFTFTHAAPGSYVVEADVDQADQPGWTQKTYNDAATNADLATPLTVAAGDTLTQDVSFSDAGEISGTVSLPSSATGQIAVDAYPLNANHRTVEFGDEGVAHAEVAAGSSYRLDVAPGTYKVRFTPLGDSADTYYPEWYQNSADAAYATKVIVTGVGDSESGIDATLGAGLNIGGTVTAAGGNQDGIVVDAVPYGNTDDGNNQQETIVSGGTYQFTGLVPSEYILEFSDPNGVYPDVVYDGSTDGTTNADDATVFAQAHGDVTANFDYSETASLTVHLADKAGKSLKGYDVEAISTTDGAVDFNSVGLPGLPVDGHPGTYEIDQLVPGQKYAIAFVDFSGEVFAPQFWGGSVNGEPTKFYTPVAGSNFLDATITDSAPLSGTVQSTTKKPIGNVDVDLYNFDGSEWSLVNETQTNKKGKYSFGQLATGSYTVGFSADETSGNYAPSFAGGAADVDSATAAYVAPGAPAVLDGTLQRGGSISGTLDFAGGAPSDEFAGEVDPVILTGTPGHFTAATPDEDAGVEVDSSGEFTISSLATGYYSLTFADQSDNDYGNPYKDPTVDPSALVVHVVDGQLAIVPGSITVPLLSAAATAHVTGSLDLSMVPDSSDLEGDIFFEAANGDLTDATINDDGTFSADLVPGDYTEFSQLDDADHLAVSYVSAQVDVTVSAGTQTLSVPVVLADPFAFTSAPNLNSVNLTPGGQSTDVGTTYSLAAPPTVNHSPADFEYQWLRNGVPIRGATSPSYTLVGADAGTSVDLRVTAIDGNQEGLESIDEYATPISVTPSIALFNTVAPSTSADSAPTVVPGQAIHANPGEWDNLSGVQYAYVWLGTSSSGPPVILGQGSTFTPSVADEGFNVQLEVFATKLGYAAPPAATSTTQLAVVKLAKPTVKTAPKVAHKSAGSGKTTYTVTPGTWTVGGTTPTYQWNVDGAPIAGETSNAFTFDPTAYSSTGKDSGITVTVDATKTGYEDGSTTVVAKTDTTTNITTTDQFVKDSNGDPLTTGALSYVGQTLTAQTDDIRFIDDNSAPTKFSYQWKRVNPGLPPKTISGATKSSYTVTAADVGYILFLEVGISSSSHAFQNTPEQAGAGTANQALVSQPATFSPSSPAVTVGKSVSYTSTGWPSVTGVTDHFQWLDCSAALDCTDSGNFHAIPKATSASYTPTAAQAGDTLSVVITGTKTGYADGTAVISASVAVSAAPAIDVKTSPTITGGLRSGNATFGVKLTAKSATSATKGVSFADEWQIFNSSSNAWVAGAGKQGGLSYTPALADFSTHGPLVRLEQTLSKGSATQQVDSAAVALVGGTPKPSVAPSVTIDSTTDPANPVYVVHGGTWPTAGGAGTLSYQWFTAEQPTDDFDSTFNVDNEPANVPITVKVTYSAPAYVSTTVTLLAHKASAPASNGVPISGNPAMGYTLSVPQEAWYLFDYGGGAASNAKAAFQWYSGTKAIPGATSNQWVPTAKYINTQISVKETSTAPDYATATNQTPAVTLAEGYPIYGNPTLKFSGDAVHPGTVLTVDLGTAFPAGVSHTYEWDVAQAGGDWVAIPGATKATYTVPVSALDSAIRAVVGTTKSGYASNTQIAGPLSVVPATLLAPITQPYVGQQVTGDGIQTLESAKVGTPLAVTPGSWNVPGVTLTYQWFQDRVIIPGATKANFTPTGDQLGSELSATVTAHASGYRSVTVDANGGPEVVPGDAPQALAKPKITGSTSVGSVLTATSGVWSLDSLTFTYQWFHAADDSGIAGATANTYTIADTDSGLGGIYVIVTASRDGYNDNTARTATTPTIH